MKKIFSLMAAACAVVAFASCEKDNGGENTDNGEGSGSDTEYAAPTITWEGHDDFTAELESEMDVKIQITAEAGIKSFIVGVDSDVLEPIISGVNAASTDMDLINGPESLLSLLSGFNIPTGANLTGQKNLTFDLSSLVPNIITIGNLQGTLKPDSDHIFTLSLTDNADKPLSQKVTFHYTGTSASASVSVDANSVDLWANTAKVTVANPAADATYSVQYREKGTETWYTASGDATTGFTLAPEYNTSTNAADLSVSVVKDGSGIYAQNTYEIRLMNGETEVSLIEYTTQGGDAIPNGDMSDWSMKDGYPYPNAEGNEFWTSGNNTMTNELCVNDNGSAKLTPYALSFLQVFACGNLYSGSFSQSGVAGTASFGQNYTWTSRPVAIKVKYKAVIGNIDNVGPYDPQSDLNGQVDKARIYAVVTDWTKRHEVNSGMGVDPGDTVWDPETETAVDGSGKIIGYASQYIVESTDTFVDLIIPFNWYDTTAKPSDGNYSLVISCATSYRGDYLTGCSNNQLWVDDFEWVY